MFTHESLTIILEIPRGLCYLECGNLTYLNDCQGEFEMKHVCSTIRRKYFRKAKLCKGMLCILVAISLISCGKNEEQKKNRLLLNNSNMSMKIGDTINLQAFYEEDQTVPELTWSSDQVAVATVDNGKVDAVGKGNAVVTAVDGNGLKAECNISVQAIEVESIKLNKIKISIKVNKSTQLQAEVYPKDASEQEIQWLSGDDDIAVVNSTGLVTGKKEGTVNIICRSANGKEASCTVVVKNPTETANTSPVQNQDSYGSARNQETYQPFYGIWCGAAKKQSEAEKEADKFRNKGFDAAVFVTTDWSNLNREKWYVVSAGIYSNKSDAKNALSAVKKVYPNAYVKYSGEWQG